MGRKRKIIRPMAVEAVTPVIDAAIENPISARKEDKITPILIDEEIAFCGQCGMRMLIRSSTPASDKIQITFSYCPVCHKSSHKGSRTKKVDPVIPQITMRFRNL